MVKLNKIDVIVLFVENLERSAAFYRDVLGASVKFGDDSSTGFDFGSVMLIILNGEGARDLLTEDAVGRGSAGATSQIVSFVDDVDAAYEELTAKGVDIVREPINREWGLRTVHFKDPDGHVWELAQEIAKATPDE